MQLTEQTEEFTERRAGSPRQGVNGRQGAESAGGLGKRHGRSSGRSLLVWAALIVLTVTSASSAQQENTPSSWEPPATWLEPIEPFALAQDVYYVGSAELAAYLFVSEAGHVLIDAPMAAFAGQLIENVRTLGFEPSDIAVVVATHGHFDHTGGVAEVLAATGAELALAPLAAKLVAAGGRGDFALGDSATYPRPPSAVRHLSDGEEVRVGPIALRAAFTPGHTRGCTSWQTKVEIGGEMHDAVLVCSLSVLDGYQLLGELPSYPGIAEDFCRSVARLESLQPSVFLANHGSFLRLEEKRRALVDGDEGAFVDPDGYRTYVERARARIETTLREQGGTDCSAVPASKRME